MSKSFDTINIRPLIRKLLQTSIPSTIMKFITNYIKGRKAYTPYRNHTSIQRQFKTGVPQFGVLSRTLYNIYTTDLPPPRASVQVMSYADDHHIYTHKHECIQEIHTTIPRFFSWTKHNNLTLNPDKTPQTLRNIRVDIKNKQHFTTHINAPKGSASYVRHKAHIQHTYSQHLSTRIQTSTNNKSTHRNSMRQTEGYAHGNLKERLWSMPLPYGRPCILDQH